MREIMSEFIKENFDYSSENSISASPMHDPNSKEELKEHKPSVEEKKTPHFSKNLHSDPEMCATEVRPLSFHLPVYQPNIHSEMIDEETQHACWNDIEYLSSRAECQIKDMKKCSAAIISNAERILSLQETIRSAAEKLWFKGEEARHLALDLNLIHNLKGDIRGTNKTEEKLLEMSKDFVNSHSMIEQTQSQTKEIIKLIQIQQEKVLQFSNDHLCDLMVQG